MIPADNKPSETPANATCDSHSPDQTPTSDGFFGQDGAKIQGAEELPQPAAAGSNPETREVPGFAIIGEIGRGGMGVVYRARDIAIDREIALKFLQDVYAGHGGATRRFLEEARITGQLQHPGIPPVHQVGSLPDGRPYLAMKLIKGQTLDQLLKDRFAPGAPNWLAVFEAVCQTVGYAHAHQVIHRDLKPANIMVGGFGEVQVMDWGLAKVLNARAGQVPGAEIDSSAATIIRTEPDSAGSLTQFGSVFGTLAYMPPEQAGGEVDRIDRRSDVFSLGAVLCVILTGKPPYTGSNAESVRHAALRGNLDGAFARLDACAAEPGLIALARRCLAVEPDDRPADASAVAEEVAELRRDSEQRARDAELQRARAEVQAAEQRKRRKVQLALASSVLTVLTLIGGGLWWLDRQAVETSRVEAERENERRIDAARNQQAIDAGLDQAEASLRKENPIDGEIDAALTQVEHRLAVAGNDEARRRFKRLTNDRRMLDRLAEIDKRRWMVSESRRFADLDYAKKHYPIAFREYGIAVATRPAAEIVEQIAATAIATQLTRALDAWWAISGGKELLEIIDRLDPDADRQALRAALARRDRGVIAQRVAKLNGAGLPPAFSQLVGMHALMPADQAVRILTEAQAAHPDHFGLAMQTAEKFAQAQPDQQIAYFRIALAIRPDNVVCRNNLGQAFFHNKNFPEAFAQYKEAIRLDPNWAYLHNGLGLILRFMQDADAAIASYKEAIRLDAKDYRHRIGLGNALRDKKDIDGAIAEYREGIQLDPNEASLYTTLGNALYEKNDFDGAIAAHKEAIRLDPRSALAHNNLGYALQSKKDLDGALAAYKEAIRFDPKFAGAYANFASALQDRDGLDGAIIGFKELIRRDPNISFAHSILGFALLKKQDLNGASAEFNEAIRLDRKNSSAHYNLGNILQKKGDVDGAIAEFSEVIRLDPKYAQAHNNLALALESKKDFVSAVAAYQKAIRLNPRLPQPRSNLSRILSSQNAFCAALDVLRDGERANPNLLADPLSGVRYKMAGCAVRAGTGQGTDAPPSAKRPALRKEAQDWLSAELGVWQKRLVDPKSKLLVNQKMTYWLADANLAAVRDADKLKDLPAEERRGWEQLWEAVRKLRDMTAPASEFLPAPRETGNVGK